MIKPLVYWLYSKTLARLVEAQIRKHLLYKQIILGDADRVSVDPTALVNNTLFNVLSGNITVGKHAFFGQNVCLLTGTHPVDRPIEVRKLEFPASGRDIVIEEGAWLATNTTVIGPCTIGAMSVVAAGAVVTKDVPPYTIVGGVPAKVIGKVDISE
ncbi:MAG: hypothetical protein ABW076_16995 [Candidatus Thiodiazotropha sp.]